MAHLRHQSTLPGGDNRYMTDPSALYLWQESGELRLCSGARSSGGLALWAPEQGWQLRDRAALPGSGLDAPLRLATLEINGAPALLAYGAQSGVLQGVWHPAEGGLMPFSLSLQGAAPQALTALVPVTLAGNSYLVSAARQGEGLAVWALQGADRLVPVAQSAVSQVFRGNDIFALEHVRLAGQDYVLALSATQNRLTSLALSADGSLQLAQSIDPAAGLFVAKPTHLEVVQVAGQPYALVGAAASSSLSVVALLPGGAMRLSDQVNDDLTTRFAGLSALSSTTVDGQVYVLAGGADDGVSLFTLLPGGRLVHLDTLADDGTLALTDPAALALLARAQRLEIFVAGALPGDQAESGAGLSWLQVDLGAIGQTRQLGPGGGCSRAAPGGIRLSAAPAPMRSAPAPARIF